MPRLKSVEMTCVGCGKKVFSMSPNFKRCDDCYKIKYNTYKRKFRKDQGPGFYAERKGKDPLFREKRNEAARKRRDSKQECFILARTKERALKNGLPFNLELSDIVIPEICPILKVPMKRNTRYAPSIDKIDPAKGYVKGNVWIISLKANMMKQDATKEELERFSDWVKTLAL